MSDLDQTMPGPATRRRVGPVEQELRANLESLYGAGSVPPPAFFGAITGVDLDTLISMRMDEMRLADSEALWLVLYEHEALAFRGNALHAASCIVAERLLGDRLGMDLYVEELEQKRAQTRRSIQVQKQFWCGEAPLIAESVLCRNCHALIGESIEEAVRRSGAIERPVGFVGECPQCDSITLVEP